MPAARQQRRAAQWQHNDSEHCRSNPRHHHAATARYWGGNEDTGGNSNYRGTDNINNQLKATMAIVTEWATMTAATITM